MTANTETPVAWPVLHGLPPILPDGQIRALVLGSFPSVASLETGQYYAHPQNRFWRMLAHCQVIADDAAAYAERVASVRRHGLAIWDLYARVRRQGSGDDRIRDTEPNAVGALVAERGSVSDPAQRTPRAGVAAALPRPEGRGRGVAIDQPATAALEHAGVPLGRACRMVRRAALRGHPAVAPGTRRTEMKTIRRVEASDLPAPGNRHARRLRRQRVGLITYLAAWIARHQSVTSTCGGRWIPRI